MSKIKNTINRVSKKKSPWENLSIQEVLSEYNYITYTVDGEEAFKLIPSKYLSDKEFFMSFIESFSLRGEFSEKIYQDMNEYDISKMFEITNVNLGYLPENFIKEKISNNFKLMSTAIINNIEFFKYASNDLKNNKGLVSEVFKQKRNIRNTSDNIDYISDELLNDIEFVIHLLSENKYLFKDKKFMSKFSISSKFAVEKYWLSNSNLRELMFKYINDSDMTKEIYYDYISNIDINEFKKRPMFLNDKDIIQEAVRNTDNFEILTLEQKSDFDILQYAAINRSDNLINYIPKEIFQDKRFLNIINYFDLAKVWKLIPLSWKKEKEVILKIFNHNTFEKKYIKDMDKSIFDDPIFARLLMQHNYCNYEYLGNNMKQNEEFALLFIKNGYGNKDLYNKLHNNMKKDINLHIRAVKEINNRVFIISEMDLDNSILENKDFIHTTISKSCNNANYYLDNKKLSFLLSDPEIMLPIKKLLYKYSKNENLIRSEEELNAIYLGVDNEIHKIELSEKINNLNDQNKITRGKKKI